MRTLVDDLLVEQTLRFRLRYGCENCAHFASSSETCSLGYPNDMHREHLLQAGTKITFCKEFDLV
ncbi:MAG: hypothetical protein QM784_06470 [Polyangiaceae bacterium]